MARKDKGEKKQGSISKLIQAYRITSERDKRVGLICFAWFLLVGLITGGLLWCLHPPAGRGDHRDRVGRAGLDDRVRATGGASGVRAARGSTRVPRLRPRSPPARAGTSSRPSPSPRTRTSSIGSSAGRGSS